MAMFSSRLVNRIAAVIFPVLALCGCATSGDIRSTGPKLAEFDAPRPLLDVYKSEIDMLTTCKVGPVSQIFFLSIDPTFDRDKHTASIALVGTGYLAPHTWGTIDMETNGSVTHVRIFGEQRPEFANLGRDVERWANAGSGC
ncbi:MAG TPA: hypothetical protein VHU87_05805 [Rhizomicrobium sp.]|nr:hypothetical protein [Rhizomicrobium sp.]